MGEAADDAFDQWLEAQGAWDALTDEERRELAAEWVASTKQDTERALASIQRKLAQRLSQSKAFGL